MPTAILTAGGRLKESFAEVVGTEIKALVPVAGRPLIYYPLKALAESPSVEKIVVVGPKAELEGQLGLEMANLIVQEGGREEGVAPLGLPTAPENILAGFDALQTQEKVLISASDIPHLTPEAVEDFLNRCPKDADICYAIAKDEIFEKAYPAHHRMRVKMKEGVFTGGNLQLIDPSALRRNLPLINKAFAVRKSKLGMVRLLGLPFIIKFLLGRLSIPEVEARGSTITGCVCRAVTSDYPGVAFDIDKPEDIQLAEKLAGASLKNVSEH